MPSATAMSKLNLEIWIRVYLDISVHARIEAVGLMRLSPLLLLGFVSAFRLISFLRCPMLFFPLFFAHFSTLFFCACYQSANRGQSSTQTFSNVLEDFEGVWYLRHLQGSAVADHGGRVCQGGHFRRIRLFPELDAPIDGKR